MKDDYILIADGKIRQTPGYWYALYEFNLPITEDQEKIAKRALFYEFMEFLQKSDETEFYHKIIVHKDFRQVPDFLGRNTLHNPSIGLIIESEKRRA